MIIRRGKICHSFVVSSIIEMSHDDILPTMRIEGAKMDLSLTQVFPLKMNSIEDMTWKPA